MTYVRIDDNFSHHPKIIQLPIQDRWTWVEVLCYCARYRTQGLLARNINGVIPKATPTFLARCVEVGLLDELGAEQFRVHDWAIYNADTIAERVAAFLREKPAATANEICRIVGGRREFVLAEITKQRPGSKAVPEQSPSRFRSDAGMVLAPTPTYKERSLPSAGTPGTGHVCPHPTCGVRKKTALKLLEHLADVHGDEAALARIHELEAQKP